MKKNCKKKSQHSIYATHFKISQELNSDEFLVLLQSTQKSNRKSFIEKSMKITRIYQYQMAYDRDDFVKNLMTVLYKFKAYRIPRIIKNLSI